MKRFTNLLIIIGAVGLGIAIVLFLYYRTKLANVPQSNQGVGNEQNSQTTPFENTQQGQSSAQNNQANTTQEQNTQSSDALDRLVAVSDIPVRDFYAYNPQNSTAVTIDGKIISITGNQTAFLSTSKIENIKQTAFSFDGTKIAALFGDDENPQLSVFDIQKKSWEVVHEAGITQLSWSPSTQEFIYTKQENGQMTLGIYDAKNLAKKPRVVDSLALQDVRVQWQSPQYVLITEKPSAYVATSAWVYNIQTKNLFTIESSQNGLDLTANNTFTKYLRLVVDEITKKKAQLSLINQETKTIKKLSLLTVPSKCSFENVEKTDVQQTTSSTKPVFVEWLLCATPQDQTTLQKQILPDSYYKKSLSIVDDILAIDPISGEISSVITNADIPFDATNIHTKKGSVFFINRYDQKLYRAPLSLGTGE